MPVPFAGRAARKRSIVAGGGLLEAAGLHRLIAICCCLGAAVPALPCACESGHTACGEVTAGSAVFIGRVLSVSPAFLNRFNRSSRADGNRVTEFYNQLKSGSPEQSVENLKQAFRSLVSGLSPDMAHRLDEAKSKVDVLKAFELVLDQGTYVTLQVRSVFTRGRGMTTIGGMRRSRRKNPGNQGRTMTMTTTSGQGNWSVCGLRHSTAASNSRSVKPISSIQARTKTRIPQRPTPVWGRADFPMPAPISPISHFLKTIRRKQAISTAR